MILSRREFSRCKALANRRLFRKFPEWRPDTDNIDVVAAYKVCDQLVHDRALQANYSEMDTSQYSHYSVLAQFTRFVYRCWLLEYDRVITVANKSAR